jgi:DNA invertase Pin-like site-specific DNA recombinase
MSELTKPTGTRGYVVIRVSKDEQDRRSQQERCERWLKARALKPLEILSDSGSRDLSEKRPHFQRLLGLIEAGQVDWVLVAERDRLGYKDAWEYGHFIHTFRNHGTQLWSAADDRELTGDDRFEPVIASLAADKSKYEQKENADRTLRAKTAAIARGEWLGGKPPLGYDLVTKDRDGVERSRLVYEGGHRRCCYYPDGTSRRYDGQGNTPGRDKGLAAFAEKTRDKATIGWVRKIFEWWAGGMGPRTIARKLTELKVPALYDECGVWVGPTIAAMLKNPIYATGVPHWNKQGHGRFVEVLGGQQVPVPRTNGKAKTARKRTVEDILRPEKDRPENAIIDKATWDKAQERWRVIAATPKAERRPRSTEYYFTGILICADCQKPMTAWKQVAGYRCSTNARLSTSCRCNTTPHELIETIVIDFLGRSEKGISWLSDNAEHAADLYLLAEQSRPLADEFSKEIGRLWARAKKEGQKSPDGRPWDWKKLRKLYGPPKADTDAIAAEIKKKEAERTRLLARMRLLDEDNIAIVAGMANQLAAEIRTLKERMAPQKDRIEGVRETLQALLEQTRTAREALEAGLPKQKADAVRRMVSRIVVRHQEKKAGTQRRSEIVEVEIVPFVGPTEAFPGEKLRAPG